MRAKIELVEMNETATTVSVTDTRNRAAVVKVFSDGSRSVLSGGAWIVENLFRSGQRASDKSAFRDAVQAARETGSSVPPFRDDGLAEVQFIAVYFVGAPFADHES